MLIFLGILSYLTQESFTLLEKPEKLHHYANFLKRFCCLKRAHFKLRGWHTRYSYHYYYVFRLLLCTILLTIILQ